MEKQSDKRLHFLLSGLQVFEALPYSISSILTIGNVKVSENLRISW